jgi:hypothetical protein
VCCYPVLGSVAFRSVPAPPEYGDKEGGAGVMLKGLTDFCRMTFSQTARHI